LYLGGGAKGHYLPPAAAIIEDHPESLTFGPADADQAAAIGMWSTSSSLPPMSSE
jgi:hypothetical protein